MVRLGFLVRLIALLTLVAPPGLAVHAMAPAGQVMAGCPDHAPPPCPDDGTARHAAGTCCPTMAGTMALPLPLAAVDPLPKAGSPLAPSTRLLVGHTLTKDPPPPRA
jgi:hypothetical protein